MASMTRGPLPPGVYWRRRLFVLAVAGALVLIVAGMLRGGSDGADDQAPVAQQAGAGYDVPSVTVAPKGRHADRPRGGRTTYGPTFDPNVLAQPSGPCSPEQVRITPTVEHAVAGRDVTIALSLRSTGPAACTWHLSGDRALVRITGRDEEVWTSRECPDAVPDRDVVVRDVVATVVPMTWNARKSDERCHVGTEWVGAGDYTVAAAALGGEPSQARFELTDPAAPTITQSPSATPEATRTAAPKGQQGTTNQQRDDLGPDGQPLGQNTDVPVR